MIKILLKNIGYIIVINAILFIAYIWALFGVAFNDTGTTYTTILDALPMIIFGVSPLFIGSIICGIISYKKYKINLIFYGIIQSIIITMTVIFYICNYVPSSWISIEIKELNKNNAMNSQLNYEEKIKEKFENNIYTKIDNIYTTSPQEQMNIYVNKDNTNLMFEYSKGNTKYYIDYDSITEQECKNIINLSKSTDSNANTFNTYYKANQSNNFKIIVFQNFIFIEYNKIIYLVHSDYTINNNKIMINTMKKSLIVENNEIYFGKLYSMYILQNIELEKMTYFMKSSDYIEIQKNDNVVEIAKDYLDIFNKNKEDDYSNYSWKIISNGEEMLSKGIKGSETTLKLDNKTLDEKAYNIKGNYNIYLVGYVNGKYVRVSNIITWIIN